jgi:carnitine O-acetyltransferase
MWFKPLIALFLPQTQRIRSTTTVTPFKYGVDEVKNHTSRSDTFPIEGAWEGKTMVESDGNYLGETFLELGPLYARQDELKPLPVPSLKETIKRFLPTALPLAESEEEVATLKEASEAFESQAQFLQERLEARKKECEGRKTSWLQEFWQTDCYLKWRSPLNFYSSYYFLLNDPDKLPPFWESTADAGIVKAAALLRAAYDYADKVTSGLKPPDVVGKKKSPLCSSGYKYLFNTCRIPKFGADTCRIYNPRMHKHAIVACRGHFFEIPLEDENGKPLNHPELEDLLYQCEEKADLKDPFLEFGWLTTWNRDDWAKARDILLERGGPGMANGLERLESAILVLNLDVDTKAESLQEQAENFYHGGLSEGMNRWWDKTVQLAVTRNGKWAYIGEHSMADGMLPTEFCEHLLENGTFNPHRRVPEDEVAPLTPGPEAIDVFRKAVATLSVEDFKDIKEQIEKAKTDFVKLTDEITMHVEHNAYGSKLVRKTGASADAYAQMAIQLAAYRMFGKLVATYESTQVRPYLHGRTESTRTVSPAALAFVEAMGKEPNKNRSPESKKELIKLIQQAAFAHVWYSKKATMGLGVDRHFFGLSKMVKEGEVVPDLFKHPVFDRSKHWRLSTSSLPTCPGFGFVVDDGMGIGYAVYDDDMVFNIAARTETGYADEFGRQLAEALDDMKTLV